MGIPSWCRRVARLPVTGTLRRLASAWLPHRCALCDGPGSPGLDLCWTCLSVLPALHRPLDGWLACIGCGEPVAPPRPPPRSRGCAAPADTPGHAGADPEETITAVRCKRCLTLVPPFAQLIAPWRFAAPVDRWVRDLKHRRAMPNARLFGTVIARAVVASAPHAPGTASGAAPLLLPVPLHARRLRERGFNHAEAIAGWAARELGLAVHARSAVRVLDTGSLAVRSRAERQLAIRGAFRVHDAVADRHVVLVDDVLTSGATAGELARECHDTGAASVSLWVVARTCVAPSGSPEPGAPAPRLDSSRASTGGSAA